MQALGGVNFDDYLTAGEVWQFCWDLFKLFFDIFVVCSMGRRGNSTF